MAVRLRIADASTPVVVLRSVHHGGLGLVRSLGRLGVPVYVVDSDPRTPAFSSRYCRGKFIWDIDRARACDSAEYLSRLGRTIGGRPILIPTSDAGALLVAEYAADLRSHFLFPDQPPGLPAALSNKKRMFYLTRECGVPTPETYFPQSRQDALNFAHSAMFPIIVKPSESSNSRGAAKSIVRSARELMEKYDLQGDPDSPNLILQEFIPGGVDANWMFNGYFDGRSECRFGATGRKIRQCPAYTGVATLGVCLPNVTVARITREFMKRLGYRGILDLGYRYDARDGQLKVFDINPRIGSTFRLFVSPAGMDAARALYLDLTGQTIPASAVSAGRKWIVEDRDLYSSFCYWRDRNLSFTQWLQSFRGVQELSFLALDDPRPFLSMFLNGARDVRGRIAGTSAKPRGADGALREPSKSAAEV